MGISNQCSIILCIVQWSARYFWSNSVSSFVNGNCLFPLHGIPNSQTAIKIQLTTCPYDIFSDNLNT